MKIKKIDITDIEGFRIGNAEDTEGGTGCTVIISESGAVGGVDVRGGGPATRETDLLKSENTVEAINAVVLSGGSAFGLEAASGVMRALAARGIGFKAGEYCVPIVSGASLFDLAVGKPDVFPDVQMGMEAVENAYTGTFQSGNHGAGTGATVGKVLGMHRAMKTGLGTFACGDGIIEVGAIAAVNACADVYNGAGNIIAGLRTSDGSAIQGTIKVLKGMIHPESEPELRFEDIKTMASQEKASKASLAGFTAEDGVIEVKPSESSEPKSDFKSDIARAIQEAYENSAKEQDAAPEEIPEEAPSAVIADEPEVSAETEAPAYEAPAQEESAAEAIPSEVITEEAPAAETADAEPAPEDLYLDLPEQTLAEPESETVSEPETAEEEPVAEPEPVEPESAESETPEEPDPFELSEEEKADMGYDIPFNTTIGCLITNARLTKPQANKLASILHDAYARAIKPVHSTMDGDTVFVLSTCTQDVNFDAFAALASDIMQYAIIDAAQTAESAYGLPAARDIIHK